MELSQVTWCLEDITTNVPIELSDWKATENGTLSRPQKQNKFKFEFESVRGTGAHAPFFAGVGLQHGRRSIYQNVGINATSAVEFGDYKSATIPKDVTTAAKQKWKG